MHRCQRPRRGGEKSAPDTQRRCTRMPSSRTPPRRSPAVSATPAGAARNSQRWRVLRQQRVSVSADFPAVHVHPQQQRHQRGEHNQRQAGHSPSGLSAPSAGTTAGSGWHPAAASLRPVPAVLQVVAKQLAQRQQRGQQRRLPRLMPGAIRASRPAAGNLTL